MDHIKLMTPVTHGLMISAKIIKCQLVASTSVPSLGIWNAAIMNNFGAILYIYISELRGL